MHLYGKIHRWRLRHMSEHGLVLLLAVGVGVLSGLAAVTLKTLVHYAGLVVTKMGMRDEHSV